MKGVNMDKVLVIPCSGIGKVQGLMAREVTYSLVDNHALGSTDTVCLALLVSGDKQATDKVKSCDCVTVDGCPKLCAQKNVEIAGGKVAKSVRMVDAFKNHRGAEPGTATALAQDGWTMVEEIAVELAGDIRALCGCGEIADGGN